METKWTQKRSGDAVDWDLQLEKHCCCCCPLWGPSVWAGSQETVCNSLRTTPEAPGLVWSPCRLHRRSDPGPAPRSGSAPQETERTSPKTSSFQKRLCRPQSDSADRSQTPGGEQRLTSMSNMTPQLTAICYFWKYNSITSHIRVLSSYVFISLVFTSFPWKGPKREPLGMLTLSVKIPQW